MRMGLATKITLPFVALFTALLAVLGVVLAREIFREIESRVEREQRFVLSVPIHPQLRLPLHEATLRGIRDAARGGEADAPPIEFAVFPEGAAPITTLDLQEEDGAARLKDLQAALRDPNAFPGLGGEKAAAEIQTAHVVLAGETYLAHYASRWPAGKRHDWFLLYPQSGIEQAQVRALTRIAGLGAIGLVLAALLGRLVAQWISRPVRRLAATAGKLAAGGLREEPDWDLEAARDEIGELTRAFRAMVESLRRSQDELLKNERLAATGKLAASVAHEIRNPLTSMRMTVQVLEEKTQDEATRQAYAVILGEIDRLALAVEELLTFARPRPPQRAPTDLNRLAADTVGFLGRQLQHARVEARMEPDAALPADLPLDANKIRQLLYNLILNAMQAMVRDGTVSIRTRWESARRAALLEVADTGPGIPEEIRGRIFDPFVSTKPGGGGLGLAIAKQIAEEHGGTIAFESSGSGTTFRVELPVVAEKEPAALGART